MSPEVVYLGNKISKEGISPSLEKLKPLYNVTIWQKNVKELQRVIGLINWFRPYVINLSTEIADITEKLKGNDIRKWSQADSDKIKHIVEKIKTSITLKHPDFNAIFYLYSDASDKGISSILIQQDGIVGIYSKKYSLAEKNYTIVERECLAMKKGLLYYKTLVYNSKVIILTDNKNITFDKDYTSSR